MAQSPEEINAALMATAAEYNAQNPTGDTEEEAEARAAAAALAKVTGSNTHSGEPEVREDTAEEVAAAEAKQAEEAAKVEADKAAEAAKQESPEDKAKRETEEAAAATDKSKEPVTEWAKSENREFNAAMNIMKASGMSPDDAETLFGSAATSGDLSKVDEAALIAKVGEDTATLIMAGFSKFIETESAAILENIRTVHESVGGSKNWDTMVTWARGKAKGDTEFAGTVKDLTAMMNSGNKMQASLASEKFMALYNGDPSNSTLNAQTDTVNVAGKPIVPSNPTITPLSARVYAEAVEDAQKNLRGADQAAKLRELSAGRAAGRKAGL